MLDQWLASKVLCVYYNMFFIIILLRNHCIQTIFYRFAISLTCLICADYVL